jgi:hypothetical protein
MTDILVSSFVQVAIFSIVPLIWWLITARNKTNFFKWTGLKKPILRGRIINLLLIIIIVSTIYGLLMMIVMTHFLGSIDTATTQFDGQGWNVLPHTYLCNYSNRVIRRNFV